MLLSNALSAATGLAIGHVLSNLLHSEAPTLNVHGDFLTLQKDAIALSQVILEPSTDAYKNASAAFKVGSDVFRLIENTEEMPTVRLAENVSIRASETYDPNDELMFKLLHAFNVSFLEGKAKKDDLVTKLSSFIAYFLGQGKKHTEQEWRQTLTLHDESDWRMWNAYTDYYDKNYKSTPPQRI